MQPALPQRDILDRALRTSWIAALALAATLAPARPITAATILAGQLIAFLHFVFLRKIVKLFTERRGAAGGATDAPRGMGLPLVIGAKLALVYGGLAALIVWGRVEYVPLCVGFALPFLMMFLKSIMLAFGAGPASLTTRRANETARSAGNAAKPAVFLLLAGALVAGAALLPSFAFAQTGHPAAHEAESGAAELPNWLVILHDFYPNNAVITWLEHNQIIVFAWIAGLLFLLVSWLAMRKPKMVPGVFQNALEWMVESMEDVCGGLLGPQIDKHFPLIGALFFYILTINMLGIIPGMKSATSSLDLTLALALITFLYVQFWGIKNLGILGYLDHLAGSPRDAIGWMMLPVMLPVHILGELAKPVSLSCRLFGNIFGEDTLIVVFVGATALLLKASLSLLAVPPMAGITALFMMLQTLTSIVQALIFSLLATVYLYMMLPHETHAHEAAEAAH